MPATGTVGLGFPGYRPGRVVVKVRGRIQEQVRTAEIRVRRLLDRRCPGGRESTQGKHTGCRMAWVLRMLPAD